MGWTNFVIIEKWKMIIETNRNVDELEDYIKDAIDNIISNDTEIDVSTSDLKVSDMTVRDLCTMASAYENTSALCRLHIDKLFLYWLESKDIEYNIESEYTIDLEEYKDKGYNIIRIWNSDHIQENNDRPEE